jgi:hypothetical protein
MVLGASNQWFSLLVKLLYIPALGTELVALAWIFRETRRATVLS